MGLENQIIENITPNPSYLLNSIRCITFNKVEEAIASLIDNSISANSSEVNINMSFNQGTPTLHLMDDGNGMDSNELAKAFTLGSQCFSNTLGIRRFGLGMKLASLSQCRELVVITKKINGEIISRSLDLDFVSNNWKLKSIPSTEYTKSKKFLTSNASGTIIIWNKWDMAPTSEKYFDNQYDLIKNYLSVCFHRFIEEKKLTISLNEFPIQSVNPLPKYSEKHDVSTLYDGKVKLTSYHLQHPDYWPYPYKEGNLLNSYKLFRGFNSQQGIYIYRCKRLLNPYGGWFELFEIQKDSQLARVVVELPKVMDKEWKLDILKKVTFPENVKTEVKHFLSVIRNKSKKKILSKRYQK